MEEVVKSNKIVIKLKPSDSSFYHINAKLIERKARIGQSITATNKVLSCGEMLKAIMPEVIGIAPNSPDWNTKLNYYFNSLSKRVTEEGIDLEIGWKYNNEIDFNKVGDLLRSIEKVYDATIRNNMGDKKVEIEAFKHKYDALCDVEANKYKYGMPLNKTDWVLYFYILFYRDVANREEDMHNSESIRFYIYDPNLADKRKKVRHELITRAERKYYEVFDSSVRIENTLILSEKVQAVDLAKMSDEDKLIVLRAFRDQNPTGFIMIADDKRAHEKAFLYRCVAGGLLRRVPNTSIYETPDGDLIGATVEDAISALKNNAPLTSRLEAQLGIKIEIDKKKKLGLVPGVPVTA